MRPWLVALIVLVSSGWAPAHAEEGMWTFDRFPQERAQRELGWAPDQAWLDRVMAGTARLPGCSASNVSGQGLILTNHHCVIACVQALSTADADFLAQGFLAQSVAEERRCPGMYVSVLAGISDVTARIDTATASIAGDGFARARDAEISRIEGECTQGAVRCEVVTLYQGGRYALYRFRRYEDVRLVFAPERNMAHFGGEIDNFNFPRFCTDFAFLRVYDGDAPAATPAHLLMRFTPLEDNEVVLVAGNPGSTSRLRTAAELSFERDVSLPWRLAMLSAHRDRLQAYAQRGPDEARAASSALQSVENSLKALTGRRQALVDPQGFARITARERDLQARVARNRASQRAVGDAWGEVARAEASYRAFFLDHQLLEARPGERSDLLAWARDIVRGAAERARPDAERLPRYTEARLATVVQSLRAQRPVDPGFEAVNLQFWLETMAARRTPVAARILGGATPAVLATRLSQSRLADRDYRLQLWEGGQTAVAASDDPMIAFVRAWDADARALRTRYQASVEGPIARAQERIARARFQAFGDTLYPDATFSPRVSYGRVQGWTEPDGSTIGAFTRIAGLYERATGVDPFTLSPRWRGARARLDGNIIFNVSTSNDVIGGNSGSPLLDREGRVVGAVFDGNIHSLAGDYYFDGALNRTVTVAATAMREALVKVYGMDALATELEGG